MEFQLIKDAVITAVAVAGLVLGIINIRRDRQRDKVKLQVTPCIAAHPLLTSNIPSLAVALTNLSSFDVEVRNITIGLKGKDDRRLSFPQVMKQLPLRIEPRSKKDVLFPHFVEELPEFPPDLIHGTHIIAQTSCGHTVRCKCDFSIYHRKSLKGKKENESR